MDEYVSKSAVQQMLHEAYADDVLSTKDGCKALYKRLDDIPVANIQPVKWISVNDRLPDENQKCLVYRDINADLKITTGIWHSDMKEFYGLRHGTRLKDTIAWMPLLESPKDGDTE